MGLAISKSRDGMLEKRAELMADISSTYQLFAGLDPFVQ